jgi:hypothetical protein
VIDSPTWREIEDAIHVFEGVLRPAVWLMHGESIGDAPYLNVIGGPSV